MRSFNIWLYIPAKSDQYMCYLFTVRMPKFISETFLKTGKRRHLDDKNESKEEEEILNTCIVCKQKISSGRNGLDQFDVKYHYTECYIQEGKFSETLEKIGGSVTEKRENKYRCLEDMHFKINYDNNQCKDKVNQIYPNLISELTKLVH